jgi:hypothetical protein
MVIIHGLACQLLDALRDDGPVLDLNKAIRIAKEIKERTRGTSCGEEVKDS